MWPPLLCAACAVVGLLLGYLACLLAAAALSGPPGAARTPSGREATDFVAAVESYLRAEGY